jgi:hypothetical protein
VYRTQDGPWRPWSALSGWWRDNSRRARVGLIAPLAFFILIVALASGGDENGKNEASPPPSAAKRNPPPPPPPPSKPKGNPDVDKHTQDYVNQVKACALSVGIVILDIQRGKSTDLEVAGEATTARDTCDAIRSRLLRMNTDHFDDQAATAWYGVDRYKSGLNALLVYLDNPVPSKLIEARNKLQEGDQTVSQGLREINARRRIYGLRPIPVST